MTSDALPSASPKQSTMEAILLVGGKGTRLHPLTLNTPKPMLKVAGIPFIAHQIAYARKHGISRIVVATSYKSEQFLDYLGDGSSFGVEIVFAIESEPLGTGGAIANAAALLDSEADQPIAILNGDILSAHDISAQILLHEQMSADATLHLVEVADARAYGSVPTDTHGRILEFIEKSENPPTSFINAGCYIFTREVLNRIPVGKVVSVEREVFPQLLSNKGRLWSYKSSDYWIDIGTPSALLKASCDLVTGQFDSPAFAINSTGTFIDERAQIERSAEIGAGSAIGASRIDARVRVERSLIGDGVVIEEGAIIADSIIGDGVVVGAGALVANAVVAGLGIIVEPNSRQIGGQ